MGLVEATGILALPLVQLKRLIAASATFQQLVGASDEFAAFERIKIAPSDDRRDEETRQLLTPRPRAVVTGRGFKRRRTGSATWSATGMLEFWLEVPVPADQLDSLEDEVLGMHNTMGAVLLEMEVLSGQTRTDGQGTYLNMIEHEVEDLAPDPITDDSGVVEDDEGTRGEPEMFLALGAKIEWF